ncbi:MAG: TolC family protein [Acidobacteria bacterium]|nr:TolC family protein [Acidobacteriota bacterium]
MNKSGKVALWGAIVWLLVFGGFLSYGHSQDSPATSARRLSLSEAVALALRNTRGIQMGQAAVARADAEFKQVQSLYRPQVLIGSGAAATRGFPLSIEGSAPSIFNVASSQALFDPSLKNQQQQAGQMRMAAEKSLEEKLDNIVAETTLTYLDLDRSFRSLEYVRGQTQSLQRIEQIVEERVRAGLEPALELSKAQLNSARARSQQVAAENQAAALEYRLRDLLGLGESEAIQTEPAEIPLLRPDETVERLVAQAFANNGGLQALEDELRAREFQVRSEEATRWPRVNLVGQYGLFSDINNFSDFFRRFTRHNATFGISVVMPIYERERRAARLSEAEAELASARYRLEEARAGISQQVRLLWNELRQQAAAREVARLELDLARRTREAIQVQYELGRVSRLAVEQATSQEQQSWGGFYLVEFQEEKARLELFRITGQIRDVLH